MEEDWKDCTLLASKFHSMELCLAQNTAQDRIVYCPINAILVIFAHFTLKVRFVGALSRIFNQNFYNFTFSILKGYFKCF